MTILQDEHKPTTPKPDSDAVVVELIEEALSELRLGLDLPATLRHKRTANAVLSALSDAGLAVLPLEATVMMTVAAIPEYKHASALRDGAAPFAVDVWREMAAAFHPSQLETKR